MTARLPQPGQDNGVWGEILNDYLSVEHNADGSLKIRTEGIPATIADGSITASKLSSSVNSYLASAQTAVQSVNGKSGQSVTLAASDISGVVQTTRTVSAGTGLTGGGDLSSNRSLSVVDDTTTQKVELAKGGTLTGTRKRINLIEGSNVTITTSDDAANNKVDVTIASAGGAGSSVAYRANYPIATHGRSDFYGALYAASAGTGQLSRTFHKLAVDAKWVRLCYANQFKNDSNGSSVTDSITVEAVAERTNSEPLRVRFNNGQTTVTIPPYGMVYSDPIPLFRRANDNSTPFLRVRTLVSGNSWPRYSYPNTYDNYVSQSTGEYSATTTLSTLQNKITTAGTITGITTNTTDLIYYPSKIVAAESVIPTRAAIALIGDSIMAGASGRADDGFGHRAIAENYAWASFALAGEQAYSFQYINGELGRWQQLQGFTHAICNYGINDLTVNATTSNNDSTVKSSLIKIWDQLSAGGIKTWQTTITPRSNDGNGVSGSTPNVVPFGSYNAESSLDPAVSAARHASRIAVNDWIRDGAPLNSTTLAAAAIGASGGSIVRAGAAGHPLSGYIEVADTVETSRNSGLWNASYVSSDYLHPTNAGHDVMAVPVAATISSYFNTTLT